MEQSKIFIWAKSLLAKHDIEINSMLDFTREEVLASMFGLLANRKVAKLMPHPKMRIEHMQNFNTILAFARNELQLRNLQITGEELLDQNTDQAAKAVMSMLSMVFKKYGTGTEFEAPDTVTPLLEWARTVSDAAIPSLKSMQGGEAFLSIISKLSENINPSEEVHETEADTSTTFNINTDNQQGNNAEYNETDLQFNSSDQTVVSDAVGMALFLVKRKFNIVPPFTAAQISSGNISSILSFLSLLHNVALVNQTKTEVDEANSKTTTEIRELREANLQLEVENGQITLDCDVKAEQVKTEKLDLERVSLRLELAEIKQELEESLSNNQIQREQLKLREKEKQERAILFKFQMEKHVFLLRENLVMLGNVGPILADIHDQLHTLKQMLHGVPVEAQLHYLQLQIDLETEGIVHLQNELMHQEIETQEETGEKTELANEIFV